MRAPSFYSDPHVQFLSQLLEEITGGHLQVPRFQRPLVWNWDKRRELLVSIRDGIPIGAIMVWRTARTTIECYTRLGPHRLSSPIEGATRQYLLDGVQRLSTLYGALHRPPPPELPIDEMEEELGGDDADEPDLLKPTNFEVFFNLRTKDFHSIDHQEDPSELMPLHHVFNSVRLLKFQRDLKVPALEDAISASDEVARAFRDYKIPIIPITTDDIDMATRTFQRINSQGTRMSEAHMVHALTWSNHFDLNRRIGEIRKGVLASRGWQTLDDDPILKSCKAVFGLDVYKSNAEELSNRLRENSTVVREVGESIGRAADFLWDDCGVPAPELVPYALQIVILAEAFRIQPAPSPALRRLLFAWLWMTTYGELFAGMSGDRVQIALSDMRDMVHTCEAKWTWLRPFEERPLRKTFDFRAARAKAYAFRLAAVQDELTSDRAGTRILADAGRRGLVQIIPWSRGGREVFSSPGNRFLVHPADAASLRESLLTGDLSADQCARHVISDDALALLKEGEFEDFVHERLADIVRMEHNFVMGLVGLFD